VYSEVKFRESASLAPPEISESIVIKHFSESESLTKSQQGGPRPRADQRSCQSDFPKASGASLGKTTPLKTLSIQKTSNVAKIWEEAERRLGASRANFSLVRSGSHYLPPDGFLERPEQLFEIRWQGRGCGNFEIYPFVDDESLGDTTIDESLTVNQYLRQIEWKEVETQIVYFMSGPKLFGFLGERGDAPMIEYFRQCAPEGGGCIEIWSKEKEEWVD
jgi:hypothetical protein